MEDISLTTFAGDTMDEETNQKEKTYACEYENDLLKNFSLENLLEEDLEDMEEETNGEELTPAYDISYEDQSPEKEDIDENVTELAEEKNSEEAIQTNATAVQADLPGNVRGLLTCTCTCLS